MSLQNDNKLPVDMLQSLPEIMRKPQAILWDSKNPGLLYIFKTPGDDLAAKAIIRVNHKSISRPQDSTPNGLPDQHPGKPR